MSSLQELCNSYAVTIHELRLALIEKETKINLLEVQIRSYLTEQDKTTTTILPTPTPKPEEVNTDTENPKDSNNADDEMYAAVAKQLNCDQLHCSHCHGAKPLQNFSVSLKKHFKNGVLARIPKVCDKMLDINKRWNNLNNAVTNTKTSIKKHEAWLAEAADEEQKTKLRAKLDALHQKLDKAIKTKAAAIQPSHELADE